MQTLTKRQKGQLKPNANSSVKPFSQVRHHASEIEECYVLGMEYCFAVYSSIFTQIMARVIMVPGDPSDTATSRGKKGDHS